MIRLAIASATVVVVAVVIIAPALANRPPSAHMSKTCSDYTNQRDAQLHKDTRDADGDGIYCESLPCPCLKPGGSGGGGGGGAPPSSGLRCGKERWPIKTLSDNSVKRVSFRPKDTTVRTLRSLHSPGVGFSTPRIQGVETTTYRVKAQLVEMKLEDDRDIHMVISEPNRSRTMIVEFPDARCSGARRSTKRNAMRKARAALVAACGSASSSSFTRLRGTATITGVGFFDVKHGQRGIAPNAIELHPILRFRSSNCTRA